ncbi:HAD-IIIC family phosphatase [Paraglaciecola sp.]|uniref:HAD-IIIC family phosphatase n=1 Tax=Paraglaciecola sp. TaxID=1920173 RepID=UPI0032639882
MDKAFLMEEYEQTMFVEEQLATRVDSLSIADVCCEIAEESGVKFEALLEFAMAHEYIFLDTSSFETFLNDIDKNGLPTDVSIATKLIIWDLDDTLWRGTLSEDDKVFLLSLAEYIRPLCEAGVMHSICSKNDKENTRRKLQEFELWDYFVFPSINWESKGARCAQIISDMQLRSVNVLFIDDNKLNLHEVRHCCPKIQICEAELAEEKLNGLMNENANNKDKSLKRLNQYKLLEKKHIAKTNFSDNSSFLKDSQIQVTLVPVDAHLTRLQELVSRTNQLNFTKLRQSDSELETLLSKCRSIAIKVSDKYGDYGVVGLVCLQDNQAVHFLFSCRILGMKVECFLYDYFNRPAIDIVDPVAVDLLNEQAQSWISISENLE